MTSERRKRVKIVRVQVLATAFRSSGVSIFSVLIHVACTHTLLAVCDVTKLTFRTFRTFHWYSYYIIYGYHQTFLFSCKYLASEIIVNLPMLVERVERQIATHDHDQPALEWLAMANIHHWWQLQWTNIYNIIITQQFVLARISIHISGCKINYFSRSPPVATNPVSVVAADPF